MECCQIQSLDNREYLALFKQKIIRNRIPAGGCISLTYRCNLKCVHCYLGDKSVHDRDVKDELTAAHWFSIIDQLVDAGCLGLLITGGEPLLRPDFADIYSYAREKGMLVTVFSNGTLFTDDILHLFNDLPPRAVEITLYGAGKATYEKITGISGSYENCLENIKRLVANRINLYLKTILMTINRNELSEMEKIAADLGVNFYFDGSIFPCADGDKAPLELRVSPEEIVEKEFSDTRKINEWKRYYTEREGFSPIDNRLYQCGSGLTTFYIDPYGQLKPCLMADTPRYDLLEGNFQFGWDRVISRVREKKAQPASVCSTCKYMPLCRYCPPFFKLENGSEDVPSQYICTLAKLRYEKITNCRLTESRHAK